MKSRKYIVTIKAKRSLAWVKDFLRYAVMDENDISYRGVYFVRPIVKFKVKKAKRKAK